MSPPVKIPLTTNDRKSIRRRMAGNYIALVVIPGSLVAAIPLSAEVYSMSQTILPWIVNAALLSLAVYLAFVFIRTLKRLGRLLADGKKFRERVSLSTAKAYETRNTTSKGVRISYTLEMHDAFRFIITYRQFVLINKLNEFFIEYKPYNHNTIDVVQTLDFNKEIEELQETNTWNDADFPAKIDAALARIRSRTDKDPDAPGEPTDN
ncbi:MAG TPA: hypothetical protein VK177_04365 [Flavobacteriales bacterium]|nr:hypothetical protein [Flavobacteriales bacterium]